MRKLIFIFLLLTSALVMAQIDAGPDQVICNGNSTILQGSGPPVFDFVWRSNPYDPTLSDSTSLTPAVQPSVTTVYTLVGRSVDFVNLVVNGNFEQGNTGITSSYTYAPGPNGIWTNGTYAITDDASYNHNNFTCDNDHTTGTGHFMVVNGSWTPNTVVWSQLINGITPDTEYEFSTWVSSLSPVSPAILQFSINGELLGTPFQASSDTCVWHQFFEEWNSGTATSAEISIVNQNTAANGNDFSLDDIQFSIVTYYYDSCTVNVIPVPTSDFVLQPAACMSDTVEILYSGTAADTSVFYWDFGSATVYSGSGPGPYKVRWPTAGAKTVSLHVDYSCLSDTTVKSIQINQNPDVSITADQTSVPYGSSTFLNGDINAVPGPYDFQWDPASELQDPFILDPETKQLFQNTVFTLTSQDQSSLCSAFDTILIEVTGGPLLIISFSASPDTICYGDSTILSVSVTGGSGDYYISWTSNPPGFNHYGQETQVKVSPQLNTTFIIEVSDGYTTIPPDSLTVIVIPQIEMIAQPADITISQGQDASFSVSANYAESYQWQLSTDNGANWTDVTDNAVYSGSTTAVLSITNASYSMDNYLYRCLLEGDCMPVCSDNCMLSVIDSPQLLGTLSGTRECEGDTIFVPCSISNFIEIDTFSMAVAYNTALMHYAGLWDINSELTSIEVYNNGDSISMYWSSQTGATISDGKIFDIAFIASSSGADSVMWKPEPFIRNISGFYPALLQASAYVEIDPLPVNPDTVVADPAVVIHDEVTDIILEAYGGSGNYIEWTSGSCDGDSIGAGNSVTLYRPDQSTTYYARWINQCGKSECRQVEVIVEDVIIDDFIVSVPNAFSPDGDGLNDKFGIITSGDLPFFEMTVFNRWGQMVFHSSDQFQLWDGTYNGAKSPVGMYAWIVKYQYVLSGTGSEINVQSGTVIIVKN